MYAFIGWVAEQPFSGRKALPSAFTYTQATAAGISAERLYPYRSQRIIDQIARGLYRWADAPEIDEDLLEMPLARRKARSAWSPHWLATG